MALKKLLNRNNIPIYPWYISDLVVTKSIARLTNGSVVKEVFFYIINDLTTIYYDEESVNDLGKYLLEKIVKDHNFYNRVINNIYDYSEKLTQFNKKLTKLKPKEMSNSALLKIYTEYEKKLGSLRIWGWMPVILDGLFKPFLSDYILENFLAFLRTCNQDDKIADYYSLLSSSEKMSKVQAESLARLKLLLIIKNQYPASGSLSAIA